ncbi:hypothetical protein Mapa_010911 [Marchantia paleacea]|nr:hypothetical protein Mapa_010911 [Marchantia paleacea]
MATTAVEETILSSPNSLSFDTNGEIIIMLSFCFADRRPGRKLTLSLSRHSTVGTEEATTSYKQFLLQFRIQLCMFSD